jgi:tetratricopeptide (TPR) repeat protein
MAEAQFAAGDRQTAISTLQNAIQSPDATPLAFESLGKMLQTAGPDDAVEGVFAQMVDRFPDDPRGYFRLGSHHGFVRDYAKALEVFGRGLEKQPNNPSLLKGASVAALRLGNNTAAVDYAQRLADLQPNNVNEGFFLGTVLDDAGRKDDAEAQYRRVLEQSPDHWPSLNNLAMLMGESDEALSLASRAAELAPDSVPVATTLGRVYFERGEYRLAASAYERVLTLQKASPEIHRRLAETYQKLGDGQKALHHEKLAQ